MKVSRAEAAQNRERIIDVAAKLFRERGFDGIGVAELMKSAGLTHGGFYGNFASKEELMAQACARALGDSLDAMRQLAERDGENALSVMASAYLSPAHRDRPGEGCVLAALGAEAARHGSSVRAAFTQGVRTMVDGLTRLVQGKSRRAKREKALVIYASMVGALVLARAIDDTELSEEVLQSVLASIAHTDSPS
jgi:TetR/AcrR family transcriptional regulator, transcriptional repressor for nem operon